MAIQIELSQLIVLGLAWCGALAAAGRFLLHSYDRRLDERFATQERTRSEATKHWDRQFLALSEAAQSTANRWHAVERELLDLKAELPEKYVRREDYIRGQSVIEAKLDGLAARMPTQNHL